MTRHVVLITYGEPPTPAFLDQLRYSWRILLGLTLRVAPIPRVALPMIAVSRARFRNRLWREERYDSPLEPITRDQARELLAALEARRPGGDWRVHVAYEFRDPLLATVLDRIPAGERVQVLPLYVADSAFTHAISREKTLAWAARRGRGSEVSVLPPIAEGRFAELAAEHVAREVEQRGVSTHDAALVLAAHGTLLEPPIPIETGRGATECVAAGIAQRLGARFGMVQNAWLNHVYGGRWTEPPVEEALQRVVAAGFRRVVYFPYGFSADNAESQLEGRIALRARPELEAVHLPCVNATPGHIAALADEVVRGAGLESGAPAAVAQA